MTVIVFVSCFVYFNYFAGFVYQYNNIFIGFPLQFE